MRIAYATTYDSLDRTQWSGSGYHIGAALEAAELDVHRVGPLHEYGRWRTRWKRRLYGRLLQQNYDPAREAFVARPYSCQIDAAADRLGADVVFSPGSTAVAYCRQPRTVAFWTDATFAGVVRLYPEYRRLCRESLRAGHALEQRAFDRCSLAIFASEWAARSALEDYQVDEAKVHVVPFGANLTDPPARTDVEDMVLRKPSGQCELLFLGADWLRKGGPEALMVTRRLRAAGVKAFLHIVGCQPEIPPGDQGFVRLHGFLNKNEPDGDRRIRELLAAAHFLILPSRAECFGIVFAEAAAFGVPSLATNVGGIPSAVADDISGKLFPGDAAPEKYAEFIAASLESPARYQALALSARRHYEAHLNWQAAGQRVRALLELVANSPRSLL